MKASQQRHLNQLEGKSAFMHDNITDFPPESPGAVALAGLDAAIARIHSLAALQISGGQRQAIGIKDELFERLIRILQKMNRAAHSIAEDVDGIEDLFRMPRKRSEEIWLATARSFYNDSEPLDEEFQQYDLPKTFRADIMSLVQQIEAEAANADMKGEQKGGATGGMVAEFSVGGKFGTKLNGIVENKYDNNPQKLAAWRVASHLEKAPKRKKNNDPA